MNLNNFTIKSQEALQQAQQFALGLGQQSVESSHILKGILAVDENVAPFLFKKLNVNTKVFSETTDRIVEGLPKVQGGDQFFSRNATKVVQNATNLIKDFDDEFVSIEHLLLSLLEEGDTVGQLMKDNGITSKDLKSAIKELRKGEKVTSQTAEETYNSLNKYALNLNELARSGKLDPVIGRDEEIRRVLQILSRRTKNNPILIGEPGVGKTAIAEG